MLRSFLAYFTSYMAKAKTRQRQLFLAMLGLFLSSFALFVVQSTMGGLQHKLVARSKAVAGEGVFEFHSQSEVKVKEMAKFMRALGLRAVAEYELELLAKYSHYTMPVVLHALETNLEDKEYPAFLKGGLWQKGLIPVDLLARLRARIGDRVRLISPTHSDLSFENIPRQVSLYVAQSALTDVPEIDLGHLWSRDSLAFNLAKKKEYNRIRVWGETLDFLSSDKDQLLEKLTLNFPDLKWRFLTWEDQNTALVWALQLESAVMLFLFAAMTLLVSLSIASGLMIFFDRVKLDLATFWILGAGPKSIFKSSLIFLTLLSALPVALGLVAGLGFLKVLDFYGPEIMPAVFVDRKIPVYITLQGPLLSFVIPVAMALILSIWVLYWFKKEARLVDYLRGL